MLLKHWSFQLFLGANEATPQNTFVFLYRMSGLCGVEFAELTAFIFTGVTIPLLKFKDPSPPQTDLAVVDAIRVPK